jgi:ketosteroid isomerase-like protein
MEEPQDLATFIEESHRALDEFLCGDPTPLQALFSQRDDVTLANPFGPSQRGWPQVRDTMARAGVNYRDGRALGFDRLSEHFTPELACIHELERLEAKVGGADERTAFLLRCTSVFRLEDGRWRIVHRHADPISGMRSAESVLQT